MKKYAKILVALTFLLGLGVAAKAETSPGITVTVPFEFVVSGKILPAGTYTATRSFYANPRLLQLTNRANGNSVCVLSNEVESNSADKLYVSFKQVGKQHFISSIHSIDDVYNIPVTRSVILEAATKPNNIAVLSGSAGSK
jgi:cobyric acid synthase